jgi:hypothetical protein
VRANRILGLLLAAATAVLAAPTTAHAAYPDQPPASSVSSGTVSAGGTITFSGSGFRPGETITIKVRYNSGATDRFSTNASSAGTFSINLKLTETGTATLLATGLISGVTATSTVHVTPSNGNGGGDVSAGDVLPKTGGSGRVMASEIIGGTSAILLGLTALWLTKTRRRNTNH